MCLVLIAGDITAVTSATADQLTVANENGPAPAFSIVTGAVTNSGTALATGDQIYDFTYGNFLPLVAGSTNPLSGDLYITHDNADIILGRANAANTANRIEGLGTSGKTFIQFGFNQNDGGDEYQSCLLYTSPSPRDRQKSRMPSSA